MGAKQPARTTARKQVAPVSKEHQEPVWAAGAPTPGGIPAHRARRLAVYRSATRLAKPQAGRALRRSRAPAQAEQSTTRVSMNAATWEAPRHAACHPQKGVHQELAEPVEARAAAEPPVAPVVSVELGLGEPTAAAPAERVPAFRPRALFLCRPVLARFSRTQTTRAAVPSACRSLTPELRKTLAVRTARSVLGHRPLAPYPPRPVPLGRSWSLRPAAALDACRWTVEPATLGNQTRR